MTIQEDWALSLDRIDEYLMGLEGAYRIGELCYRIGGCEVRLHVLPEGGISKYRFQRTLVVFSGEEAEVKHFHRQFMLRFLSIGG